MSAIAFLAGLVAGALATHAAMRRRHAPAVRGLVELEVGRLMHEIERLEARR